MENQRQVWNAIAPEWHEFKTNPSESATEFLNKSKGNILDFGSGSGRNILGLKEIKNKEFYLIDFSEEMLKRAEERGKKIGIKIHTKVSELDKTDFPDNFFDAAICVAAIHCIETDEKRKSAIRELFRILKPRAKLEIEVWNKDSERYKKSPKEKFIAWRDKGRRYYYFYTKEELKNDLENVGFKILEERPHNANIIFIVEKP